MGITNQKAGQKFMAVVHIAGLAPEEIIAIMPKEDQIVRELMDEGIVQALHVRADLGGAFILGASANAEEYRSHLQRLPLFPHMTIDFVPLLDMPEF